MQCREPQQDHDRREDDSRPLHMTVRIGQIPSQGDPQAGEEQPQATEDGVPEDAAARCHSGEADENGQPKPVHRCIFLSAVEQSEMRPPYQEDGLGDWYHTGYGHWIVRSVGHDILDDETFLVALHELVEMKLCHNAGITQESVDAFDAAYNGDGEPGDEEDCPYRRQHRQACLVEFLVADMIGIRHGRME